MTRLLTLLVLSLTLVLGCRTDQGQRVFSMNYTPLTFDIPAGYSRFQSLVFSWDNLPTNFAAFATQAGVGAEEINVISPTLGRVSSLDGLDFGFLNAVSVRICPAGTTCTEADEVFFSSDLYRRNWDRINLDPGLRNCKDLLTANRFKMEVVFFLGETSPYNMSCRFDYAFDALK